MRTTMSEMMDQKLEKFEARLEQKLNEKLAPIYERLDRLEADVKELKKLIPRVDKLEADMKYIKVVQLENNIIPRLNSIEACYVETSKRYIDRTEQIDDMRSDIKVLKNVVFEHSQKLSKISV